MTWKMEEIRDEQGGVRLGTWSLGSCSQDAYVPQEEEERDAECGPEKRRWRGSRWGLVGY